MASETFTGADSRADTFVCPLSTELARFVNLEAQFFPKFRLISLFDNAIERKSEDDGIARGL
jgi:hypothetical protein